MFCWLHIATVSAAYLLDCWGGIAANYHLRFKTSSDNRGCFCSFCGLIFITCNVYYQGME